MSRWLFIISGILLAAAFLSGVGGIWIRDTRWLEMVGACAWSGGITFVVAVFACAWES